MRVMLQEKSDTIRKNPFFLDFFQTRFIIGPLMTELPPRPNLTVLEVAEFLGVSDSVVYEMIHANEIPWAKFKGQYRIPRDLFLKYYEKSINVPLNG